MRPPRPPTQQASLRSPECPPPTSSARWPASGRHYCSGGGPQTGDGHDMDHYPDDLAAVVEHLDLHDAIHVGHSTGGGEVAHYLARHGEDRAAKAVLISAVP